MSDFDPVPAAPERAMSPRALADLGLAAIRDGRFAEAIVHLEQALPHMADNEAVVACYCGALTMVGDRGQARRAGRTFVSRRPLGPAPDGLAKDTPRLLVIRGFDQTYPTLVGDGNGGYAPSLRGGHFSLEYLLSEKQAPRQVFTIPGAFGLDPDRLPPFWLMLNTIAEPDNEAASLRAFEAYLDKAPDTPVINHPSKVWQTTRDGNWQRLRGMEGFTFPRTERLTFKNAVASEVRSHLQDLDMTWPVILRRVGTQTGRTTMLLRSDADVATYADQPISGDHYAIEYREILWQGTYFRKLRLFWIDGAFYPVVCHLDTYWNVHGGNRKDIMRTDENLMAEEKRFLANWQDYVGRANADILYQIAAATGLEFFGIDFTIDDTDRIFIYELNAAMRHSYDHARNFPYKLPYDKATTAAFTQMITSRMPAALAER